MAAYITVASTSTKMVKTFWYRLHHPETYGYHQLIQKRKNTINKVHFQLPLRNRITSQLTTFKLSHKKLQNRFIEGLPEKVPCFVRVGQPQDLTAAFVIIVTLRDTRGKTNLNQNQPTSGKCQLCRQQGLAAFRCKTQCDGRQGNTQSPGHNRQGVYLK